ncbi:hypothetical protein [Pararhizobium sp. IMCC21322]|uniref:hypothetical protein n=1 Tax=Pararhizobium sp. IMCC21322 TaxID=3067903 RepID=UPI002741CD07|nr:hypothetical protein [Pararhizobium sp. IMCC21322]
MAKSEKLAPKTAQLMKLIARETDTARAAHFRRVIDGTARLEALTGKTDLLQVQRNALIDALPPVKPVVDETVTSNMPEESGFAALQAQICALQAQLAGKGD